MLGLRVCAQLETYEFRFLVYVPHGSDSNSVRVRVMENNEVAKQTRNKQQLKLIHYIRSPQCADRMLSYGTHGILYERNQQRKEGNSYIIQNALPI